MEARIGLYNEADFGYGVVQSDANAIAHFVTTLPEGHTWRYLALFNVPTVGNWSVSPEVVEPSALPPLSSLERPDGAPR